MKVGEIKIQVDTTELDEAIAKAEHLIGLIEQAKGLRDEAFPNVDWGSFDEQR